MGAPALQLEEIGKSNNLAMPFKKGQSGNPKGKKPGTLSKKTIEAKQKVDEIAAYLESKGVGLPQCAIQDPKWFFETFYKLRIPREVDARLEHEIGATAAKLVERLNKAIERSG